MWNTQKEVEKIKEQYPVGTRIKMNFMQDPHAVPVGMTGTVEGVDDQGQIIMFWDNGQGLNLIPGKDQFEVMDKPALKEDRIRVLIVPPLEYPRIEIIDNTLEAMQQIVGGYIEEVDLGEGAVMFCNEEGKLKDLPANRRVGNDIIAGTFFIAGSDYSEYLVSLDDGQCQQLEERFHEFEDISQDEMFGMLSYEGMK